MHNTKVDQLELSLFSVDAAAPTAAVGVRVMQCMSLAAAFSATPSCLSLGLSLSCQHSSDIFGLDLLLLLPCNLSLVEL